MDRCDQCGFVYDEDDAAAAPAAIAVAATRTADTVAALGTAAARRPEPGTWSPLEYACHVRDVLLVQRERVLLARRVHRPHPEPMGRDERVEHDGYAEQDPADVARQLRDAAWLFTNVLHRLEADDWQRTLVYNWPRPAERTLRWVAVHTRHECEHHLGDVTAAPAPPT